MNRDSGLPAASCICCLILLRAVLGNSVVCNAEGCQPVFYNRASPLLAIIGGAGLMLAMVGNFGRKKNESCELDDNYPCFGDRDAKVKRLSAVNISTEGASVRARISSLLSSLNCTSRTIKLSFLAA